MKILTNSPWSERGDLDEVNAQQLRAFCKEHYEKHSIPAHLRKQAWRV
jgi:hypothetical protein